MNLDPTLASAGYKLNLTLFQSPTTQNNLTSVVTLGTHKAPNIRANFKMIIIDGQHYVRNSCSVPKALALRPCRERLVLPIREELAIYYAFQIYMIIFMQG